MQIVIAALDENGAITNGKDLDVIEGSPGVTNVLIFSHGWWTSADAAEREYTQFDNGLAEALSQLRASLQIPPDEQLLPIGIQWPSMVSAALGPFRNIFEAFSYPDMRNCAEVVARSGVSDIIRRVWRLAGDTRRLRIHLLGHSMGCRVICQALSYALQADSRAKDPTDLASAPLVRVLPNVQLSVVLFQGAIDNNALERLQKYGVLSAIDGLRVMVTRSDFDDVLKSYPSDDSVHPAMGAKGPTVGTFTDSISHFFDQLGAVAVRPGSDQTTVAERPERFIVADLTELHRADRLQDPGKWGGFGGNHSDIYSPEVYKLVTGFLFGAGAQPGRF
jgi:pimeloyl-ACP methyl ester carboxylesterase